MRNEPRRTLTDYALRVTHYELRITHPNCYANKNTPRSPLLAAGRRPGRRADAAASAGDPDDLSAGRGAGQHGRGAGGGAERLGPLRRGDQRRGGASERGGGSGRDGGADRGGFDGAGAVRDRAGRAGG